jgi:hypothetical protein
MRFPTGEEQATVSAGEFGGRGTEKEKWFAAQISYVLLHCQKPVHFSLLTAFTSFYYTEESKFFAHELHLSE